MSLQMIPSMTSSAPPPMLHSRRSLYSVQPADLYCIVLHCTDLYSLLTVTSSVKPIPPQNWRQESVICLASQGVKDISRQSS